MVIESIIRVSTQGMSRPYICRDEAGRLCWCKGNHTGIRALVLEWMCAKIASELVLPVPDFAILKCDPVLFRAWCSCYEDQQPQIVTDANPYVFASYHIEAAKDVFNTEPDLAEVDPDLLTQIYLFDEHIQNIDRTDVNSNLLINHGIHIIDHNNAFSSEFKLDVFRDEHILRWFASRCASKVKTDFNERIHDLITDSFLANCWSEMPSAWTDAMEDLFPLERFLQTFHGVRQ